MFEVSFFVALSLFEVSLFVALSLFKVCFFLVVIIVIVVFVDLRSTPELEQSFYTRQIVVRVNA